MALKKLFILVSNGGDGSYYPVYTFNEEWIKSQEALYSSHDAEITEFSLGCDGDGFHYDTLTVPEECSLESLGISYDCALND